jgi:3-dehydroquinate synthase
MNVRKAENRTAVEIRQRVSVTYVFPVIFTRNAFSPENTALAEAIGRDGPGPIRVAAVVHDGDRINHP